MLLETIEDLKQTVEQTATFPEADTKVSDDDATRLDHVRHKDRCDEDQKEDVDEAMTSG